MPLSDKILFTVLRSLFTNQYASGRRQHRSLAEDFFILSM